MKKDKLSPKERKQTISIQIPNELIIHLDVINNKSKFFEWLLIEHFNTLKNGK
jgi:hypothetical protein